MYVISILPYEWGKLKKKNFFSENYSVFQGFLQAKFVGGGSILSPSQFLVVPAASKNEALVKSGQYRLKIIGSLTEI